MSSHLSASEVVHMLNCYFSCFDTLCQKYGIEKVKTIGDEYFCIGLNTPAANIIYLARDMLSSIDRLNSEFGWNISMRIGIAFGDIICGVIGEKMLTFDAWGPAVTLARHLECHGEPQQILVTEEFCRHTQHIAQYKNHTTMKVYEAMKTNAKVDEIGNVNVHILQSINNARTQTSFQLTGNMVGTHSMDSCSHPCGNIILLDHSKPISDTQSELEQEELSKYLETNFLFSFKHWKTIKDFYAELYKPSLVTYHSVIWLILLFYLELLVSAVVISNNYLNWALIVFYISGGIQILLTITYYIAIKHAPFLGIIYQIMTVAIGIIMLFATASRIDLIQEIISDAYLFTLIALNVLILPPTLLKILISTLLMIGVGLVCVLIADSYVLMIAPLLELGAAILFDYYLHIGTMEEFILKKKNLLKYNQVIREMEKIENVLLSVAPKPIIERLKANPALIYDEVENACVLFCSLSGFPSLLQCENAEYIKVLNSIFMSFDELTMQLGCEKVKTFGETYIAMCGVPIPVASAPTRIAELALRFLEVCMEKLAQYPQLQCQIGIQQGSLIAAVIGSLKYKYDIYGDTVNIASRMMSTSEHGKIQVTERMYQKLHQNFILEKRGDVYIKGKGDMTTWWLVKRKT